MTPNWLYIKEVFSNAIELDTPERGPYLDTACDGQPEVRNEVDRLLQEVHPSKTLETSSIWESASVFQPGQILKDRFEIIRRIGSGGFGEVYEAHDRFLNRRLALKTLRREVAACANSRERFKREIAVAQNVSHRNLCRVFDVIVSPLDEADVVSFTMELLDGETLSERLSRVGAMTEKEAWPLVDQIIQGLAALHARGIVHRDLKPGNILIAPESADRPARVVLMDFGLARPVAPDAGPMWSSDPEHVLGTLDYVAPERLRGQQAAVSSDIYSLGVLLHSMVFGCVPSTRSGGQAVTKDRPWTGAIASCIDHVPNHRPQSARRVGKILLAALR